jgi:hypothetical protein
MTTVDLMKLDDPRLVRLFVDIILVRLRLHLYFPPP